MKLIDSGSNVDAQSNSVRICWFHGRLEYVLLKGETPLIAACKTNNIRVVKFLLSKGCNIRLRDAVRS